VCNAFNHAWDCRCGWGGDGHLGRRGPGGAYHGIRRVWDTPESYLFPNGNCPRCGEEVFVCRYGDGRAVLLDELGPPWPRHACGAPRPPKPAATLLHRQRRYAWQEKGWSPFIVSVIASISPDVIRMGGTADGKSLDLYMCKRQFGTLGDLREEIERSAVHLLPLPKERFRLSALLPPARPVQVDAFASSIEAFDSARATPVPRARIRGNR
jgi:hypothetical protein